MVVPQRLGLQVAHSQQLCGCLAAQTRRAGLGPVIGRLPAPGLRQRDTCRSHKDLFLQHDLDSEEDRDFDGLLPDEDWVVTGRANDSLTMNTDLGKAVHSACDELDTLASLENGTLHQAQELLAKVGFKGTIFASPQSRQETKSLEPQPRLSEDNSRLQ